VSSAGGSGTDAPNRLSPLRFVLAFGVVSMLADFVYEGARSVVGPYLAALGASATVVGVVTGAGEAAALVFRIFSGRLSDRSGRHWALSIGGYLLTIVAVPVLAAAQMLWQAVVLVIAERFGKAVRTPARDTMLSQAGTSLGQGRTFALHEAMDQSGALVGPLVVAGIVPFLSISRRALLVWLGALVWGLAMGVHESTMRAAVADLIPIERRGTGYGVFTAVYGLAWLGGAAAIGALYAASVHDLELFVVAVQAAALVAFVPLAAPGRLRRG
jgi:MFS family permease